MNPPRRALVIGAAIVAVVSLLFTRWLLVAAQEPLYRIGRVRAMALAAPDGGTEGARWTLEPGVEVAVHRAGHGPRVLFVHGGPGVPWAELPDGLLRLAATHEVITWDQRGCGRSTRPVERLDAKDFVRAAQGLEAALGLTAQVADLERLRLALGEAQLALVGHGFGALVAALYAAEFPEHVRALVLVSPADLLEHPSPRGGAFLHLARHLPDGKRGEFEAYARRALRLDALLGKTEAQLAAFNAELPEYAALAGRAMHDEFPPRDAAAVGGFAVQAAWLSLGGRHDWREAMRVVSAPVLVVHGARDFVPEAASRAVAAAFPHARVEVMQQAGHFPFVAAPEDFARLVSAFLAPP